MAAKDLKPEASGFMKGLNEGFADLIKGGGNLFKPILDGVEAVGNGALGAIDGAQTFAVNLYHFARGVGDGPADLGNDSVATTQAIESPIKPGAAQHAYHSDEKTVQQALAGGANLDAARGENLGQKATLAEDFGRGPNGFYAANDEFRAPATPMGGRSAPQAPAVGGGTGGGAMFS